MTKAATHHSRQPARVPVRIAQIIGDDVATLALEEKLVWLPAHKSPTAAGETKHSNGTRLSCVDWKANRSVDIPAKTAAGHLSCGRDILSFLESAEATAAHATCCFGIVTHAASNHRFFTIGEKHNVFTRSCVTLSTNKG